MIGNILYMIKYTFGEIFSSGGATLYKSPSDQTVLSARPTVGRASPNFENFIFILQFTFGLQFTFSCNSFVHDPGLGLLTISSKIRLKCMPA